MRGFAPGSHWWKDQLRSRVVRSNQRHDTGNMKERTNHDAGGLFRRRCTSNWCRLWCKHSPDGACESGRTWEVNEVSVRKTCSFWSTGCSTREEQHCGIVFINRSAWKRRVIGARWSKKMINFRKIVDFDIVRQTRFKESLHSRAISKDKAWFRKFNAMEEFGWCPPTIEAGNNCPTRQCCPPANDVRRHVR
ncbi:unannotated protein [freshwater metagenome]|uniref:Unannotated protein n=1 Tax=freshwater metagenome TaxID=449393 RepID=A0A6J6FM72_9ZZZZ